MKSTDWKVMTNGVWRAQIGKLEPVTPLSLFPKKPRYDALERMGDTAFPLHPDRMTVEADVHQTIITLPLEENEKIYGLGLQFMRMNHRGRTRYLRTNSDPKEDTGESHAPVPFYVSSRGYGVLINTSRAITIYCGSSVRKDSRLAPRIRDRATDPDWQATPDSDTVEIVIPKEQGAEIYLFAGPTLLDVVRRYNLFSGGGPIPPRWGLGFWHRVSMFADDRQAMAEAMVFRERDIPCDVIGLEPGWHSNSYPTTFEWSQQRFPQPAAFIGHMLEQGFRINLWENPYVAPASSIYPKLEKFAGSHTVWGGIVPDYTIPEAQETLTSQHAEQHVGIGVAGYKVDEVDGSELTRASWMFPAHATFPSGLDGEQMRQNYGLIWQNMLIGMFRAHNRRTYGLVRGSASGASSLPFVLYSDLYNHKQFVRALCNSSFGGLLWTPELRETESAEEFVRRLQVVCFSPLAMLNAWASGVKPWSYPEAEWIVRKYIQLRMRLMPYLYTAFARYHFDGTPPFRAMALEIPPQNDKQTEGGSAIENFNSTDAAYGETYESDIDDQYMMGDSLLVAPLFSGETSRRVILPAGNWYDFETGECFPGGREIQVSAGIEKIPLFVRDGGIIPMMPALPHAPKVGEAVPLEVRHYGRKAGSFLLYDDDGETFDYEQGNYQWRTIEVRILKDGSREGSVSEKTGLVSSYGQISWTMMGM